MDWGVLQTPQADPANSAKRTDPTDVDLPLVKRPRNRKADVRGGSPRGTEGARANLCSNNLSGDSVGDIEDKNIDKNNKNVFNLLSLQHS